MVSQRSGPRLARYGAIYALLGLLAATPAASVSLDRSGGGQVLLFPFFTAELGWDTYINVSIPPFRGRILRLRFLEPEHGELVRTLTLYSKDGENLRAAVTRGEGGATVFRIAEGGCILADDGAFGGNGSDFPLDVTTGMLEVYLESRGPGRTMADLSCEGIAARWQAGGIWRDPTGADDGLVSLPGDDLIAGRFTFIDVGRGLAAELPALGLRDFNVFIPHVAPEATTPNLFDADPVATLVSGEEVIPESGEGIDALALALEDRGKWITNEVITEPNIGAATDWVIAFPLTAYRLYRPDRAIFGGQERACSPINLPQGSNGPTLADRLGSFYWFSWGGGGISSDGYGVTISPTPIVQKPAALCTAVNVFSFGDPRPVLVGEGSPLLHDVQDRGDFQSFVVFPNSTAQLRVQGPLFAFRVTTFVNGTLQGGSVLANYMQMTPHETERPLQ